MPTFLLSCRDQKHRRLGADFVAAWSAWLQSIGADLVDRGNPVREAQALGDCGVDTVLSGFSLVAAADLETAVALARRWPGLRNGGGMEVGRVFELWPGS